MSGSPQDAPRPQDAPPCEHDGETVEDMRLCSAVYTWTCMGCGHTEQRWFREFTLPNAGVDDHTEFPVARG